MRTWSLFFYWFTVGVRFLLALASNGCTNIPSRRIGFSFVKQVGVCCAVVTRKCTLRRDSVWRDILILALHRSDWFHKVDEPVYFLEMPSV